MSYKPITNWSTDIEKLRHRKPPNSTTNQIQKSKVQYQIYTHKTIKKSTQKSIIHKI